MQMDELMPGQDGLYAICCLNVAAKNEDDVRADFGKHGEVVSVRQTGSPTGMVFIRFRLAEEAKRVLADRSFNASGDYTRPRLAKHRSDGQSNSSQDSGGNGRQFSNKQDGNEGHSRPDGSYQNYNRGANKQGGGDTRRSFTTNDSAGGFQNRNWQKNGGDKQDGDHANNSHKSYNKGNGGNVYPQDNGHDKRYNKGNVNQHRGPKQDVSDQLDEPPPLVRPDRPVNGDNDLDGPPPLITNLHNRQVPGNVIIANIALGTARREIYNLCSHLDPIHISNFDITGIRYSLQYCHLYFANPNSAVAAEEELHGLLFRGKRLIVKRFEKLFDQ